MGTYAQNYFQDKRVVVIGAGYIGGYLARACLMAGAQVTALTRNAETAEKLSAEGVKIICDDIANDSWHDKIGYDHMYCVNAISSGRGGLEAYQRSYVEGMGSVARWLRKSRISTITYTSSTSVYPQTGGEKLSEGANVGFEGDGDTVKCLIQAERTLMDLSNFGCRWFILRLAGIYGPGRHQMLDHLRRGDVILGGNPEQHLNLIHRDDVVAAILTTWSIPFDIAGNEIFNVVDDGQATRGEIGHWLAQRLGCQPPSFDMSNAVRKRPARDRIIANDKIKAKLGWRPAFASYREGYAAILSGS